MASSLDLKAVVGSVDPLDLCSSCCIVASDIISQKGSYYSSDHFKPSYPDLRASASIGCKLCIQVESIYKSARMLTRNGDKEVFRENGKYKDKANPHYDLESRPIHLRKSLSMFPKIEPF